jgi:pimeloyl-ACP methyl ester carboxylesterase
MRWLWRGLAVVAALLAVTLIAFRTPDTDAAEMRAKYGSAPSQFVGLNNGLTVHLRDEGPTDAPAIILLHGSNADLHTWEPWVAGLRDEYRVIRFDQRGHGLTGPAPGGDYSRAAFAADVAAVAGELGLDNYVVGGNSMGGGVALEHALADPSRLAGVVLVDASGAPRLREVDGNIGFTIAQTPGVSWLMTQITPRSLVEKSLRQSVSNEAIVTDAAVDRYWELLRYPGNRAATVARFRSGRGGAFDEARLRALDLPVLVQWGEEDALIPVDAARWFAARLPRSTLALYPGTGHLPMEEAPSRTLADLTAWLASL